MDLQQILNVMRILGSGLKFTFGIFAITIVCSIPLGMLATIGSNSRFAPIRAVVRAYVFLMRGTPLLLQLFFVYFGLPYIPVVGAYLHFDRFTAGCVAFVLNYAAYFCEIFRGGLLSIDKGQYEAAKVLGYSRAQTMFKIVLPQMFKVSLPPVANETINLVKDSALITAIGIEDIMYWAKKLVNSMGNVIPYIVAAALYMIIIFALTKLFSYLEKKLTF